MTKSLKVQEAAVRAALEEGGTLDSIANDHPDLADGVRHVREEQERKKAPKPRGSGSVRATYLTPPRL